MASNLLSRLLPTQTTSPSIYETLRRHEDSDSSDVEERAGLALDEENLRENYHHFNLDDAHPKVADSHITDGSRQRSPARHATRSTHGPSRSGRQLRPRRMQHGPGLVNVEEADDEVPTSLLIEGKGPGTEAKHQVTLDEERQEQSDVPTLGPVTADARRRWQTTQEQQRLHMPGQSSRHGPAGRQAGTRNWIFAGPKEKAMWRWANVENLDNFLNEIYAYFIDNGIWSIVLRRALNLLTFAFVVGFSTFLSSCIDYGRIPNSTKMSEIVVVRCMKRMSTASTILLWMLCLVWIWKLIEYIRDFRRLRNIHEFYFHLLGISNDDLQTISWQDVVSRLMALRDANPATAAAVSAKHRRFLGSQSKQRMDAHDIANRLMRKENYLIALFNKEILDLTLPVPYFRQRQMLTRTLMWNIDHCILDFVFDRQGQVHATFLKDTYRSELSDALRKRFLFAGVMNILTAPFLVAYFMMLYFFQYFNEYQKNPSAIGSRQYTLFAKWKFREFNELHHLFKRRIDMSYPFASRYIDQFPKDKTAQLSRFVSFVAGALGSVLFLATVFDPELFLGFEITRDRTALFYLGVFGSIWAVSKSMVPEENLVFDPEYALQEVIDFTHYCPNHWTGRLHSDEVRREFAAFYQVKVVIFLEEILSMIFTPFMLFFTLPSCSERLIDFFREFTVHVDGLGYVCSFAVFDFKKKGSAPQYRPQGLSTADQGTGLRDDYYATKDQKLEASYWGFMNDYARNPKTGIPFLSGQFHRRYHAPPPFPGLTSPNFPPDPTSSGIRNDYLERGHVRLLPSTTLGPRGFSGPSIQTAAGGMGNLQSPLQSLLLDPHHQPASPAVRRGPSSHPSKSKAKNRPESNLISTREVDGREGGSTTESKAADTSVEQSAGDSRLGEPWRVSQAAAVDEDEESADEGVRAVTGDQGTGVLGMIVQFQKAQTERRGIGI